MQQSTMPPIPESESRMAARVRSRRVKTVLIAVVAFVVIGVIVWIDIATQLWSEVVILSGLAAGFITFTLTVLVLDRIAAHRTERRWAPVTRLALSEFLHVIADEERSEISRGRIVPRSIDEINWDGVDPDRRDEAVAGIRELCVRVLRERTLLSDVLSRWASFLSSSGDNESILRHIANIATELDGVRDAALEVERAPGPEMIAWLNQNVRRANEALLAMETELRDRLRDEERIIYRTR